MLIPKTRAEAIELYNKRLRGKHNKLKYDMYLGGLICCSPTEFERCIFETKMCCHLCCYYYCDCYSYASSGMTCEGVAQETLSKPWDEDLYLTRFIFN